MGWMIAISIAIALGSSLILVPTVRWLARRLGIVDRPDAERKVHERPVALGGGVAVFLAVTITFSASLILDRWLGYHVLGKIQFRWYMLFLSAFAMLMVGLVDDTWNLRGRQKLLLQMIIISLMIGSGTIITKLGLFGYEVQLGAFGVPITMLWVLLAVNALNLIDGADGMAATVGMIIAFGLGIVALGELSPLVGLIGFALGASLLGFLVFNRPPASIYLGDAGSMMIGLFVGVLAVWSAVKESTILASAPMAILAIPLFDSTAAIVRRRLTGRSIYATDRGHMHHLLQLKYGPVGMLFVVGSACLVTTTLAVISTAYNQPWIAAIGVAIVIALLIKTRSFGHSEFRLIFNRCAHFVESFFMHPGRCANEKQQRRLQLQGNAPWELVWEPLVEFAKQHKLARMKIDISMAWLHESYHATWQSVRLPERAERLVMEVPLFAERQLNGKPIQISVGRLELMAVGGSTAIYQRMEDFLEMLEESKTPITKIMTELENQQTRHPKPKSQPVRSPSEESLPDLATAASSDVASGDVRSMA